MENGLAKIDQPSTSSITTSSSLVFEPNSVEAAIKLANLLVASRLLPDGIRTPEAAFTIIMTGRELGLTAMQSIRGIHIVKGRAVLAADLMVALVKQSADCEYFRLVQSTDTAASYETKRRGESEPTRLSFTIEQARGAGLLNNDNWKKFPAAMLRARCSAALCRAVYPDKMLGVYETDELAPGRGVPDTTEYTAMPIADVPAPAPASEPAASEVIEAVSTYVSAIATAKTREDVVALYKAAKANGDLSSADMKAITDAAAARTEQLKQAAAA